jgi:hypothetical protein
MQVAFLGTGTVGRTTGRTMAPRLAEPGHRDVIEVRAR